MRKGQSIKIVSGKYAGRTITLTRRWPGISGEWSGTLDTDYNSAIVRVSDLEQSAPNRSNAHLFDRTNISALAVQFEQTFKVKLAKYWLGPLRLDVVRFDEEIVKPNENESTSEAIARLWGKDAVTLVKALL